MANIEGGSRGGGNGEGVTTVVAAKTQQSPAPPGPGVILSEDNLRTYACGGDKSSTLPGKGVERDAVCFFT